MSTNNCLLTTLYPRRCELCGDVVAFDELRCEACRQEKRITEKICPRCGREVRYCSCKRQHYYPAYKGFCAPYYFQGSIVNGIYRLKNDGYTELVPAMARDIAETLKFRYPEVKFDAVTGIPMSAKREHERGYNQSALLAKAIAAELGVPYINYLVKVRSTKSQRTSNAIERRANVYAAYEFDRSKDAEGKTILIADDVKTSGGTIAECAKMLRIFGAEAVYACALTVTKPKKK